jgi:TetR/AcrR family transcriptional regulator, transcriptional repressor for nem operon
MRKGEQTRLEIIRKAAPIFNQKGYDGAALSDLMRATGLEKGGIYRHFTGCRDIALRPWAQQRRFASGNPTEKCPRIRY